MTTLRYQDYVGWLLYVAVDTEAAASLFRLAEDPVLRQHMGDAGRPA